MFSSRLKIAAVFLGSVLHCNYLCSSSSKSFNSTLWYLFLFEFFQSALLSPIFQVLFQFHLCHFPVAVLFFTNFNCFSFEINYLACFFHCFLCHFLTWGLFFGVFILPLICRCSHITCNSYFSLLVYVNKTPQPSTTIFSFCI